MKSPSSILVFLPLCAHAAQNLDAEALQDAFRHGCFVVAQVGLGVVSLVACGIWLFRQARGLCTSCRAQPLFRRLALSALLVVAFTVGGTKTNGVPPNMNAPLPQMQLSIPPRMEPPSALASLGGSVPHSPFPVPSPVQNSAPIQTTPADIARGWRIESVATNAAPFAAMPSNAVAYAPWSLRGGRETWFPLDLGGFAFPLGTNRARRLRVLSGGMVEIFSRNGPAALCAAKDYASLIPGYSRFRWADADDGAAKILRWEGLFANRDRTEEYEAEIMLFANGDFTTRSNDVETVCRRVNPDDWDGDGLANAKDSSPTNCDGDFFGVANALPANANPDAYYGLDLSVTGHLGVATIRVTCDGASDLGDHVIIVRTNEVCHVPLLAGATYAVESDLPFEYSAVSSEYAEIATNAGNRLTVSLPLELSFERVQMRGGSGSYIARTSPIDVGPRILDVSGGCCACVTNETGFLWDCRPQCLCGGSEHALAGAAKWEGYSYPFSRWGRCPCYYEDQAAIDAIESRGVGLEILDAAGNAIEWKYPVLVGESVVVKATVGGSEMTVSDFAGLFGGRIRLKAYYVDSDGMHDIAGAAIPVNAATAVAQGQNVFLVPVAAGWLQSNGIVRNADDGILSKTSIDMSDAATGDSNRQDSDIFDANVPGRLYGRARGSGNGNSVAAIPEGAMNLKTIQAAGVANLIAYATGASSSAKQCQQQADFVY